MLIRQGGTARALFNVHLGGVDAAGDSTTATVYLNGVLTAIVPTITSLATGLYVVEFGVPTAWVGYDQAHVRFSVTFGSRTQSAVKSAGVVAASGVDDDQDFAIERLLDLAEADETFDNATSKARKLLRGTNVVLLEKNVVGTSCTDSVQLTE